MFLDGVSWLSGATKSWTYEERIVSTIRHDKINPLESMA
jgi:hypothetical protein